jgi:hypothetical protein
MMPYKDFIDLMEKRGYTFNRNNPITIDESNPSIKTFSAKNGNISKILELQCPKDTVISVYGKNNSEDWKEDYSTNLKCFNDENKEPFQEFHQCIVLTTARHTIADIIVTKILQNEINRNDPDVRQLLIYTDPILKFIGSDNLCEYPIWSGNYKTFNKEFLNDNFNLYSEEKIIFYVTKPDIDITKVKFDIKVDIFEIKEPEELIILDVDKIANMIYSDYKSTIKTNVS